MTTTQTSPTGTPTGMPTAREAKRRSNRRELRRTLVGLAFISPWLVGLLGLQVYPFFASLYYSLRSTTLLSEGTYIGLENYRDLIDDPLFWQSLRNTFYFTSVSIVIGTVVSIGLAMLLNQRVRGMSIYRVIFYLPSIVPLAAVSVIWIWILHPTYGLVNYLLERFGLPTVGWFSDPSWAMPGLIVVSLWGLGNAMIIYLAGLQDIPGDLYEAAQLDGANAWQRTVNITIPLLSPVILFNVIVGLIGGFQYFVEPYVITQGGPVDSTLTYGLYLYNNAFEYFRMGYAAAMAWVLFVIIMLITVVLLKTANRWVFYQGQAN